VGGGGGGGVGGGGPRRRELVGWFAMGMGTVGRVFTHGGQGKAGRKEAGKKESGDHEYHEIGEGLRCPNSYAAMNTVVKKTLMWVRRTYDVHTYGELSAFHTAYVPQYILQ